jgi:predicted RNase H-like HicB family nuclease
MDYLDQILEKLKEWAQKVVEALLGSQPEPEPEMIPIPVNDRRVQRR